MDPWKRYVLASCAVILCLQLTIMALLPRHGQQRRDDTTVHGNAETSSLSQYHHDHRQLTETQMTGQKQKQQQSASNNNNNKQKIVNLVGVGLPRTGSEAMHKFWTCHGIPSVHYCCPKSTSSSIRIDHGTDDGIAMGNAVPPPPTALRTSFPCDPEHETTCGACVAHNMQTGRPALQGCGTAATVPPIMPWSSSITGMKNVVVQAYAQIDVETSDPYSWFLPQAHALAALAEDNNNNNNSDDTKTIWILTQRKNATQWATSVLHWHSVTQRLGHALNIPKDENNGQNGAASLELPQAVTYEQVVQDLIKRIANVHDTAAWKWRLVQFEQAYLRHLEQVRAAAQKYKVPLVEVMVDGDDDNDGVSEKVVEAKLKADLNKLGVSLSDNNCWNFDAPLLDDDWRDFSFPF